MRDLSGLERFLEPAKSVQSVQERIEEQTQVILAAAPEDRMHLLAVAPDINGPERARIERIIRVAELGTTAKYALREDGGSFAALVKLVKRAEEIGDYGVLDLVDKDDLVRGLENLFAKGALLKTFNLQIGSLVGLLSKYPEKLPLRGVNFPRFINVVEENKSPTSTNNMVQNVPGFKISRTLAKLLKTEPPILDTEEMIEGVKDYKLRVALLIDADLRGMRLQYRHEAVKYFRALCANIEKFPERCDGVEYLDRTLLVRDPGVDVDAATWDQRLAKKIAGFFMIFEPIPEITIRDKAKERFEDKQKAEYKNRLLDALAQKDPWQIVNVYSEAAAGDYSEYAAKVLAGLIYDHFANLMIEQLWHGDATEVKRDFDRVCDETGLSKIFHGPRQASIFYGFLRGAQAVPEELVMYLALTPEKIEGWLEKRLRPAIARNKFSWARQLVLAYPDQGLAILLDVQSALGTSGNTKKAEWLEETIAEINQ